MGGTASKNKKRSSSRERDYGKGRLRGKVRQIEGDMSEMVCERKKESAAYERDMLVFKFKEAEWKQEKKMMREEVKMLRNMVEEKEEKIGVLEGSEKTSADHENSEDWEVVLGSSCAATLLVEQMREERARRDETVEKWKQLYLTIKMELDDLIQRTHCESGLYWRAEEEDIIVEELKVQLKVKEEIIESLNSKIASMENEQYKREREIDILRQSLRIMSCKRAVVQATKNVSKDSQLVKKHTRKL
ncbi:uncharacterized protein LOC126790174 [Argentina anserina]|uniref:uncharacterized protein LOC126790174 n=1 Tax=Argentina anserina TaxID=57926 RepID=UPI0021769478|nr:uncharacterized protein LOC126790174 [Potentilla anserina]